MPAAARDLLVACDRYLALSPDKHVAAVLYRAGWINHRHGHMDEAVRYLQRLIDEFPDAPDDLAAAAADLLQEMQRPVAP